MEWVKCFYKTHTFENKEGTLIFQSDLESTLIFQSELLFSYTQLLRSMLHKYI